MEIVKVPYSV